MAEGKIKKLKVKQLSGIYGDYIPLGADAANVDLTNGQTVEENINYINTELLVAKDVIDEVTASSFTLPIASNLVLGGIKIGEGLSIDENGVVTAKGVTDYNDLINTPELAQVATSGSYNDLLDKPTIPAQYVLPIATAADLGGIRIGTGLNIDATGVVSVDVGVTDYNDLENLPDLTIYAKIESLSAVATSGDYNDLSNIPTFATVATSGSYNDLSNKPTIPSTYILPAASTSALGGVMVDGVLLAMNGNILTAPGYLPLTGGTIKGNLNVKNSSGGISGGKINFGDGDYVYLTEDTDDYLTIYGKNDITFSYSSGSITLSSIISSLGSTTTGDYVPLTGGTMTGPLHLISTDNSYYGGKITFGDSDLAYIMEETDDTLTVYGNTNILLKTASKEIYVNNLSMIVTGSYIGDGNSYQEIDIGFEPKYVIIFSGEAEPDGNEDGTLCMLSQEGYINHYYWTDDLAFDCNTGTSVYLYDYGFDARSNLNTNWDGATYSYIAFQ